MAVKKLDWELSKRGLADAARHREKKKEAIRSNIAEIIGDTAIITRKKGQIVKVPIRGLKSYRFIFRRESEGGKGLGQGEGQKGDVIGRQPAREGPPGRAGDQPGLDYIETEVDIDELIEMMLEDLGLPNLKEKKQAETIVPRGWKFEDIEKKGMAAHLDKKRTVKEAIKREAAFVAELMRQTGASEGACREALSAAKGDLLRARSMLLDTPDQTAAPYRRGAPVHLFDEDLRYRIPEQDAEVQSHAAVLAMMDVSGSMGTTKKYLARSFFFWLVESLRQIYRTVEIRFIAHTTEAKLVDEETFFHKGESGGTFCHSAYDLAAYLVQTEYPSSKWNVYAFHFSDGEDFEPDRAVSSARRLMELGVNMMGYAEVQASPYDFSNLMSTFAGELQLQRDVASHDGFLSVSSKDPSLPFAGVLLKRKEHVYPALREFLKKDRAFR
jgi:hypothetical protein